MAPSIHNLLSSLRSPIFQTLSNPSSSRMGTKYLRSRLRGPSVASYYPQLTNPFPKLSLLNKTLPTNPFAGWEGTGSGRLPETIRNRRGKVILDNIQWKNEGCMLRGREVVDEGFVEVNRKRGLGWLEDPKEQRRLTRVARKRRLGKGPPRKGQGKRSQMKKK